MFLWERILQGNKKDCEINWRGWMVSVLVLSRPETLCFKQSNVKLNFFIYTWAVSPQTGMSLPHIFVVKYKVLKDRSNSNTITPSREKNHLKITFLSQFPLALELTGMLWVLLVYTGTIPPSLAGKIRVTCSGPRYLWFINSVWKQLFHRAQILPDLSVKPEALESNYFPGRIAMDGCTVTKGAEGFEKGNLKMEYFFLWFQTGVGS